MTPRFRHHLYPVALAGAIAASTTLVGCDGFVPELGQQTQESCSAADSDPSTDVKFGTDIVAGIFQGAAACLPCHDPLGADPEGYQEGGLDLTSYANLRSGGVNSASAIAIPGDPCHSWLWLKLTSSPPSGSQMPLDRGAMAPAQVMQIHDWIAEGARDN